jgi:leucyl-tRNA synthetase
VVFPHHRLRPGIADCLPDLDWPDKTKKIQTNWIGRSEGAEIVFGAEEDGRPILDADKQVDLRVFTTRADTLMGVTYVVVAPESELCELLTTDEYRDSVTAYREQARKASDIERMSTVREKTGVFTGSYAIHPVTGEKVPVWAADYVIAGYGTGVVMAVPAHDERDYEFAKRFDLPIRRVIRSADGSPDDLPFIEKGVLTSSGEFDNLAFEPAVAAILAKLSAPGQGSLKINYRLRDWLVSRQRYWGTPIPMVHCEHCGVVPVPEDQLPVELPYDVEFTPDGESPLKKCRSFIETTCPIAAAGAARPGYAGHLCLFILVPVPLCGQSRTIRKPLAGRKSTGCARSTNTSAAPNTPPCISSMPALSPRPCATWGISDFDEPFRSLVHQGTILGSDGQKMSKSRGNTISPDDYILRHGSDAFRMYLGFGFAYTEGGPWSDDGMSRPSSSSFPASNA